MNPGDEINFDDHSRPAEVVEMDVDEIDARLAKDPAWNKGAKPADKKPVSAGRLKSIPASDSKQISNVIEWMQGPLAVKYFGRAFELRIIALAWVVNPSSFDGKSLSELADSLGVTVQALSKYTSRASRIFKLRNRAQIAHGKRWQQN